MQRSVLSLSQYYDADSKQRDIDLPPSSKSERGRDTCASPRHQSGADNEVESERFHVGSMCDRQANYLLDRQNILQRNDITSEAVQQFML